MPVLVALFVSQLFQDYASNATSTHQTFFIVRFFAFDLYDACSSILHINLFVVHWRDLSSSSLKRGMHKFSHEKLNTTSFSIWKTKKDERGRRDLGTLYKWVRRIWHVRLTNASLFLKGTYISVDECLPIKNMNRISSSDFERIISERFLWELGRRYRCG